MAQGTLIKKLDLWHNNEIQFARLLCELVANCDDLKVQEVADSMDLDVIDVNELFDRANDVWERSKAAVRALQLQGK
jgi:hypothetical protein